MLSKIKKIGFLCLIFSVLIGTSASAKALEIPVNKTNEDAILFGPVNPGGETGVRWSFSKVYSDGSILCTDSFAENSWTKGVYMYLPNSVASSSTSIASRGTAIAKDSPIMSQYLIRKSLTLRSNNTARGYQGLTIFIPYASSYDAYVSVRAGKDFR